MGSVPVMVQQVESMTSQSMPPKTSTKEMTMTRLICSPLTVSPTIMDMTFLVVDTKGIIFCCSQKLKATLQMRNCPAMESMQKIVMSTITLWFLQNSIDSQSWLLPISSSSDIRQEDELTSQSIWNGDTLQWFLQQDWLSMNSPLLSRAIIIRKQPIQEEEDYEEEAGEDEVQVDVNSRAPNEITTAGFSLLRGSFSCDFQEQRENSTEKKIVLKQPSLSHSTLVVQGRKQRAQLGQLTLRVKRQPSRAHSLLGRELGPSFLTTLLQKQPARQQDPQEKI